jgi:hypothetical protein
MSSASPERPSYIVRVWRWIGRTLGCHCSNCEWNIKQVRAMHEVVNMAKADCCRIALSYEEKLQKLQKSHE